MSRTIKSAVYKLKPSGPARYAAKDAPPAMNISSWEKGKVYTVSKREWIEWLEAQGVFRVFVEYEAVAPSSPPPSAPEPSEEAEKAPQKAPKAKEDPSPASKAKKPADAKPAAKEAKPASKKPASKPTTKAPAKKRGRPPKKK